MVSVFPATSDGLDANATRRHRNGMAPARPLLPPTHQDANMGERQYATKHAIHPRIPILTMNLGFFSLYRSRRRTRHKTRPRRHHHLQPRWSPARLSPLITRRPSRGCARGEGQDNNCCRRWDPTRYGHFQGACPRCRFLSCWEACYLGTGCEFTLNDLFTTYNG